jgi:hypothetical protein
MIQGLNADIMQVSAHMAESFTPLFATRGRKTSPLLPALEDLAVIKSSGEDFNLSESPSESLESEADARDALAQAVEVYGATMVEQLQRIDHAKNPILLQLAFQAGLSAYTHWIITSWFFEDPEDEILLSETYARVREAGTCCDLFIYLVELMEFARGAVDFWAMESSDAKTCPTDDVFVE